MTLKDAEMPANNPRNRYKDVLPCMFHRFFLSVCFFFLSELNRLDCCFQCVFLSFIDDVTRVLLHGIPGNDYINANFVKVRGLVPKSWTLFLDTRHL